jgi:queuine tRNA-ribosyltransferase
MKFTVTHSIDGARHGVLATPHGELTTPFFMPDATRASVRGLMTRQIIDSGIEAMVVNTYHLLLQPGMDVIRSAGGVHAFMRWQRPLLSDSGGYQVFSLIHKNPQLGKITEDGAEFRHPKSGKLYLLTPEKAIQIQFCLGVDMMVCLDDPPPNSYTRAQITEAVERSLRWARRCKDEYEKQVQLRGLSEKDRPLLFGVVQGGAYKELRKYCAEGLISIGFDGYGFGARHVDQAGKRMDEILAYTASVIPEDVPRFALGVGTPSDIYYCWKNGWDMFDCVIPTREGRHGRLFYFDSNTLQTDDMSYTTQNVMNAQYEHDNKPVKDMASSFTAYEEAYTKSYLRHLLRSAEPLGASIASMHNLSFYATLIEKIRRQT